MVMNFIRKLMYGRYGSDQLSFFLLVVYIVLILLSGLPHLEALSWLALAVLLWDVCDNFFDCCHSLIRKRKLMEALKKTKPLTVSFFHSHST